MAAVAPRCGSRPWRSRLRRGNSGGSPYVGDVSVVGLGHRPNVLELVLVPDRSLQPFEDEHKGEPSRIRLNLFARAPIIIYTVGVGRGGNRRGRPCGRSPAEEGARAAYGPQKRCDVALNGLGADGWRRNSYGGGRVWPGAGF